MYPNLIFEGVEYPKSWLEAQSGRIAAGLRAKGLKEADCVALMMRNCPEYVAAVIACRRAGLYVVAVNWHFKAGEVRHILDDSSARAILIHADLIEQAQDGIDASVETVVVKRSDSGAHHNIADAFGEKGHTPYEDLGVGLAVFDEPISITRGSIPYTSGTTGRPKGVRRRPMPPEESRAADARLRSLQTRVFGIGPESVAFLSAPIYHSAPMSYLVCSCLVGATLVLEPGFDALRTLELVDKYAVTNVYLVPTMMQRLLRLAPSVRDSFSAKSVERAISTGSSCSAEVKQNMIDWWGPVVFEAYASSETGYITLIGSEESLAHPKSVGKTVGSALVRIVLDDGTEAPVGVVGQIYVRQPDYPDFTYTNNEEARAAVERDDLISVGDMGYLDGDGYLYISDRKSDMVISGGVNIYPAEVEAELLKMPGVADCAVFGIPDDEYGESLAAVVQLVQGAAISDKAIKAHLQSQLANYKVPRVIEFRDDLPREDSGKIFKRVLREPYWRGRGRSI